MGERTSLLDSNGRTHLSSSRETNVSRTIAWEQLHYTIVMTDSAIRIIIKNRKQNPANQEITNSTVVLLHM